ncbi:uncharacterized protein LOC110431293 [Sorghum bicolor]|uniref:uncharacterized protein LOC110431293 n=1 Tax=Sorghum bicolor TaxID=4558 RepID=UPI000B4259C4|nr:uncharacterized protein LOC110431293 [Sorghum bicolor]|eukprot:XP_021305948.1 uncharacterized protein LOC110431293 [Sorghum bicolor]
MVEHWQQVTPAAILRGHGFKIQVYLEIAFLPESSEGCSAAEQLEVEVFILVPRHLFEKEVGIASSQHEPRRQRARCMARRPSWRLIHEWTFAEDGMLGGHSTE